jgi:peptidoglycan hydrolase CwlO-like protein
MAKALRALVIVLLVLSIASLVLGIMLFSKKGVIKERTQKLEAGVTKIAQSIRMEGLDANQLKDVGRMQAALDQVAVAGDNLVEELDVTKQDLAKTRQDLDSTKTELATTKTDLEAAKTQVVEMTAAVEKKDAELAQANGKVTQLEQDKSSLQVQIDELNNQLVKAEEETRDLQDQVTQLDKVIKDMEAEQGLQSAAKSVPPGTTGKILYVNPNWNFVVLDIGSKSGLVPTAEMLVHRADQLVGKVRISTVEDNMAVAEIINDWERIPLKEGDHVLF